ncbi:pyridoxamine 5'-phosphate oxidase family protein [Bacillus tuaregi]|uniref:pyridoxamine 5'-phosphate oxidase family protein n=1 Tax=Bacillus tuaregi TaxID=1816695 RepID=UPI0008F8BBDC|nr:pyridoxamine 5'-phosphate oxidase family protein [Bacillus tuaregi]
MSQEELKRQAMEIISSHRTGILANVENNRPHARYMTFYNKDLNLYTPTKLDTEKTDEIEKNPAASVLLGYEDKGLSDRYIEVSGTSRINQSQTLKEEFWDDSFTKWFTGPDDPNYVFLEIEPAIIRILNNEGGPPQEFQVF